MRRARYWPTQSEPSAQARPELSVPGAGMRATTAPVAGSILWMLAPVSWNRCVPSNAVPASHAASSTRTSWPLAGSRAWSLLPAANQTWVPSWVTPAMWSAPRNGPYSRRMSAGSTWGSSARDGSVMVVVLPDRGGGEEQHRREAGDRRREPAPRASAAARLDLRAGLELGERALHGALALAEREGER